MQLEKLQQSHTCQNSNCLSVIFLIKLLFHSKIYLVDIVVYILSASSLHSVYLCDCMYLGKIAAVRHDVVFVMVCCPQKYVMSYVPHDFEEIKILNQGYPALTTTTRRLLTIATVFLYLWN